MRDYPSLFSFPLLLKLLINKDGNIHKNEYLKMKDKKTLLLVECQNRNFFNQ